MVTGSSSVKGNRRVVVVFLAMLLLVGACKHEPMAVPEEEEVFDPGWQDPGLWISEINTMPCNGSSAYFQNQVYPLIFTYCTTAGCHNGSSYNDDDPPELIFALTSYQTIMQQVDAGDANNSDLWADGINETGGDAMPPSDHPQLTPAQEQLVFNWIEQGALNNSCNTCDTLSASYGTYATVSSIFQAKCNGCHSGSSPDGNLDLSQYDNAHAVAISQTLWRVLAHAPGYAAMPPYPGGAFLPACDMYQIRKWIANGAPN